MAIAETLAALSAAMQAVDFWQKYGGPRQSVITQLNIGYQPERYAHVEREIAATQPQHLRFWQDLFDTIGGEVEKCKNRFVSAIKDDTDLPPTPAERDALIQQMKSCICRSLRLLKDSASGKPLPSELQEFWDSYECSKFFRGQEVTHPVTGSHQHQGQLRGEPA